MALEIRPYREEDLAGMCKIWNEAVESGCAFPQVEALTVETAAEFFAQQTETVVAAVDKKIFGMYILHPNGIGRCAHIANASFTVASGSRGLGLGRELVKDALSRAARKGFVGMQFNAVHFENEPAIHLYESLGFQYIGTIPEGYITNYGSYDDIRIYYRSLRDQLTSEDGADSCGCCG